MPVQKNTSVTLGEHFEKILRLLEEREAKLEALRRALTEGEQSGLADYSLQNILDELESED